MRLSQSVSGSEFRRRNSASEYDTSEVNVNVDDAVLRFTLAVHHHHHHHLLTEHKTFSTFHVTFVKR